MKITEDCINHNALRLIRDVAGECWTGSEMEHYPQMLLAYIHGVTDLAEELKKVLSE